MQTECLKHKFLAYGLLGAAVICLGSGFITNAAEVYGTSLTDVAPDEIMEVLAVEEIEEIEEIEAVAEIELVEEVVYGEFSFAAVEDYVCIWSEPNQDSEWVGKLYTDNWVSILSIDGSWAEVESGSVVGYVELEYLLDEEAAKIRSAEIGTTWVVVNLKLLNVKAGPSNDEETVGTIYRDEKYLVVGDAVDGWQMIQYEGNTCYVLADFLETEVEYSVAESKEEEEARVYDYVTVLYTYTKYSRTTSINFSALEGTIDGAAIVEFAAQFLGNPYVWGGTNLLSGCDCSGFVQAIYGYAGYDLPRSSAEQQSVGVSVSYSDIQIGDIVCYSGHVGIYIGNDKIISAVGEEKGINISNATYLGIVTIRRVL